MSLLEALILGVLQGITEFFPISSSGHLLLARQLFGFGTKEGYLLYTVVLHFGTVTAIVIGLWPTIRALTRQRLYLLAIAIAPLFPIVFLIKPIKSLFDSGVLLGPCFIFSGLWILSGEWAAKSGRHFQKSSNPWRNGLSIGIAQAVSVLPGVSRLGATTSTARWLGWSCTDAITFSFLLSIPTVLGAVAVEMLSLLKHPEQLLAPIPLSHYILGFATALVTGLFALRGIQTVARRGSFFIFGVYCLGVGVLTIFLR